MNDEDLATPEYLLHAPVERFRLAVPDAVAEVARVVVDNPGQFALVIAGTVVLTRAAANIVRPRTPLQAVALMVVLQAGLPVLAKTAMDRGWLRFRVRDADGKLVPLVPGKAEDAAAQA